MKLAKILRTLYFTERLQWLLLTVSGFHPATLLKKRFPQKCFSVNFAKFLRTFFDRAIPDDCFLSFRCATSTQKKGPAWKNFGLFPQDALKIIDTHKQGTSPKSGDFLQNQGTFSLFSKKSRGDLPAITPASCVPEFICEL